jgi:hypothetical protein
MFNHLVNIAQTRSISQALGFFVFHVILLVGLSTVLGHVLVKFGVLDGVVGSFFDGGQIHTLIGAVWTLVLGSMVLQGKKLTNDILSVVITLVGVYLAYSVNVLLGMVVVSYLTTIEK